MRGDQESSGVSHAVFAPPLVDGVAISELDAAFENGARELVLDLSRTTHVDGDAVVLLAWVAQKLENAGGRLSVTARRIPEHARVTKTLWMGDLTRILGVHPVLDKAVLHHLTAGARGVAPQ